MTLLSIRLINNQFTVTFVFPLHSNALRQAKAAGDILVVGLVGDAEVLLNKGTAPIMPFEERYEALKACKWVDEVIRCVCC